MGEPFRCGSGPVGPGDLHGLDRQRPLHPGRGAWPLHPPWVSPSILMPTRQPPIKGFSTIPYFAEETVWMAIGRIIGFNRLSRLDALLGLTAAGTANVHRRGDRPADAGGWPMNRNVLFITVDQWRGDSLSALGHPVLTTPALDRLAVEGMLLATMGQRRPARRGRASTRAPTCTTTGSVLNDTVDLRFTTIALLARQAGYDPGAVSAHRHQPRPPDPPGGRPPPPLVRRSAAGFRAAVHEPWEAGSQQWAMAGIPGRRRPGHSPGSLPADPGFRGRTGTGRRGHQPGSGPTSRRRPSWSGR